MDDDPRGALARAANARGVSLAALSRLLGRNSAYVQQYVRRGSPRILPERERAILADYLGVSPTILGAPTETEVGIPWLDVAAAAGPGALVGVERERRRVAVAVAELRALGIDPARASIIDVHGESMAPTLENGDRVLVDTADASGGAAGIHVLRLDDALAIKRLRRTCEGWDVLSDNPAVPPLRANADRVAVIGRARLVLRRL